MEYKQICRCVFIVYNNRKLGFVEVEMQASGMPKYGTGLVNQPTTTIVSRAYSDPNIALQAGIFTNESGQLKTGVFHHKFNGKRIFLNGQCVHLLKPVYGK